MKIIFKYDQEKDIQCLLAYGKGGDNSTTLTKTYQQLINQYGSSPTEADTAAFIEQYILDNNINIQEYLANYQQEWDKAAHDYHQKAESIFGVSLPENITVYLTVNNRCPYSIKNNYFFVTIPLTFANKIIAHELWHFYTWYKFGITWQEKLGGQKYNDLKEALTVLLEGDQGYTQHEALREIVARTWAETGDIDRVWITLLA